MVFKRSEYKREYKIQNLVKNIPTYYDNLTYRNHRRELENAHTSIAWGSDETTEKKIDDAEENVPPTQEKIKVSAEPTKTTQPPTCITDTGEQKVEEICTTDYDLQKSGEQAIRSGADAEIQRQSIEEKQLKKAAKEKLVKYVCKENINIREDKPKVVPQLAWEDKAHKKSSPIYKPKKGDDKTFVRKGKFPPQPKVSKSLPARPKSAPSTRQSVRESPRPPFIPYGFGDSERKTGGQRSHNVLASTDVYPAALKAHQKQVDDALRRKDADAKSAKLAKKKRQLFKEKIARDAAFWKSEYGFRYPTYPTTEYAKNCDRPKRCKSAFGLR